MSFDEKVPVKLWKSSGLRSSPYMWIPDLGQISLGLGLRSPSALVAVEVVRE